MKNIAPILFLVVVAAAVWYFFFYEKKTAATKDALSKDDSKMREYRDSGLDVSYDLFPDHSSAAIADYLANQSHKPIKI